MRNMIVRALDHVMFIVLSNNNPTDAEWDEAVALGRKMLADAGGDPSRTGGVAFSDGGSPSSKQRQKLRELYGDKPPPLALVTDSVVARGAATIFKLFWPSSNAVFSSAEWERALRHAGLTAARDAEAITLLAAMQAEVGELAVMRGVLAKR